MYYTLPLVPSGPQPVIFPVPLPKYEIQARSFPPVIIILIPLEWLSPSVLKTQTGPIDRKPTSSFQNYEFHCQTKSLSKKHTSKSTCVFFKSCLLGGSWCSEGERSILLNRLAHGPHGRLSSTLIWVFATVMRAVTGHSGIEDDGHR